MTNRGFDSKHPILGNLLDFSTDRIAVDQIPPRPRGALGRECKKWAAHLGTDFAEFTDFLGSLTLLHRGSEGAWDEQARAQMKLAGLRDDDALLVGKNLVRTWVKTGADSRDTDSLKQQVVSEELLARTGTLIFQVNSMYRDNSSGIPNAMLDFVALYSGDTPTERRALHHLSDWRTTVQPALAANVRQPEAYRSGEST